MKELFKLGRIKAEEILEDISTYTQDVYKQAKQLYQVSSPWGQIQMVLGRLSQMILFYIEDAQTELNINTASRPDSIRGLAQLAGHDVTRAVAANGDLYLSYNGVIPKMTGTHVIIPNYNVMKCKDNGLEYVIAFGQDEIKVDLYGNRERTFFKILQGTIENQTFTGTGASLQSFPVAVPTGTMIDNWFVNVYVNGKKWKKYDSLLDIPLDAEGYLVKTGITGGVDVFFGNSNFGKIPESGNIIEVQYLITAGLTGNIREVEGVQFEFVDAGYDIDGNEINLNEIFNIGISNQINFGSDPESTYLTRLLAPKTSRSYVLANPTNYVHFFEKFQLFSYINAYTEYNEFDPWIDNVIYLLLIPDINTRFRAGENYFTIPVEYFKLSDIEKWKVQTLLEESGQKIVSTVVSFVEPTFKKYGININLSVWEGYSKDVIYEKIVSNLSEYFSKFKRKDFLPKSDLIAILETIEGIDSVSFHFISELIETELRNLMSGETVKYSVSLTETQRTQLLTRYETLSEAGVLTNDMKINEILQFQTFNSFVNSQLDINGDIVLAKNEIPLIRGGWLDRNGNYYSDVLDKNKLSSVNVGIVRESEETTYATMNRDHITNIRES